MNNELRLSILADIETLFQKYAFLHKDVLTETEAAHYIGKQVSTLRSMVSRGKIAVHKPGGRKGRSDSYFLKVDLNEYMTRNRVKSDSDLNTLAATYNFNRKAS